MAIFTAIAGVILGAGAAAAAVTSLAISLAVTTASIAYQVYRTNKLKAELDKRKQVNVAVDGEPFYLSVVYGRAKVSGGKVKHKLKDSYVYAAETNNTVKQGPFYSLSDPKYYYKQVSTSKAGTLYSNKTVTEIYWDNNLVLGSPTNNIASKLFGGLFSFGFVNFGTLVGETYEDGGFIYSRGEKVSTSTTSEYVSSGDETYLVTTTTVYYKVDRRNNANKQVFTSGLTSSLSGSKNEYLFVQQAITYGGINRVVDITVDDKNWDDDTLKFGQRIVVDLQGGTASNLATANGLPSTNLFTNTAYATMCFRLNREEYNYNGSPNVSFFVEGMRIRDIIYDPILEEYSVTATKTYSNNPALVLLDYLTNPVYGKGLSLEFIDLQSFYVAKILASTTILQDLARDGRVNGRRPDVENEDGSITTQPSIPNYSIPLYECNTVLDTERPFRENIEIILESMEEAELVWSGGTYKLVMNSPRTQEDIEELVTSIITEDDIVRGSMELEFPDSSARYNQCVARFMNEFENFVDDTVTWPLSYSAAYNTYLAEDSGVLLKTEVYLPCTSDPYHALAKAEQIVRTSRRQMRAKFVIGKKGLTFEPGDIISITDSTTGLTSEVMKVESVKLNADLTAQIEARQYDISTFAWNVPDGDPYFSQKIEYYYSIAKPLNVIFTPENTTGIFGVNSGKLDWDYPNDVSVGEFLVEISSDNGVTWQTLSTTLANTYDVTGLNNGVYKFSVRSRSPMGRYSERVIATDSLNTVDFFTIQRATSDQVAIIYSDTEDELTNTQSYTLGSNQYVAYYIYSGDLPTLPIRAEISFSKFVGLDGVDGNDGLNTALVNLYAVNENPTSAPSLFSGTFTYDFTTGVLSGGTLNGWSQSVPSLSSGLHLWVSSARAVSQESTTSLATSVFSAPVVTTRYGEDGTNGSNNAVVYLYFKNFSPVTAPTNAISGIFTYTFSTGNLTGGTLNGWQTTLPTLASGEYVWTKQALASSNNLTDTIAAAEFSAATCITGVGTDGANGLNTATVSLYAKNTSSSTPPTAFTGTGTYTFGTGTLTGMTLLTWSLTPPTLSTGEYLWVRQAVASSTTTTDTISIGEWSAAVVLSYSGVNGANGLNGLNSRPLSLYAKNTSSSTPPTAFTGTGTYTFATDSLTGLTLNSWSRTVPSISNGEYLWLRQAMATSTTTTDTIPIGEWSTAVVISVGGSNGAPGVRGAGWWRYDAGSADVSNLSTSAVNTYFSTATGLAPVAGDRLVLATTHVSGTTAYIYQSNATWLVQAAFIDGNLLVAGTITGNKLAANNIITTTAQIGDAIITGAKIGDLEVGRIQLGLGSISEYTFDSSALSTSVGSYSTWTPVGYTHTFTLSTNPSDVPRLFKFRAGIGANFTSTFQVNTTSLMSLSFLMRFRVFNVTKSTYVLTTADRTVTNYQASGGSYNTSTTAWSNWPFLRSTNHQPTTIESVVLVPYNDTANFSPGDTIRLELEVNKTRNFSDITSVLVVNAAVYEVESYFR
jgi:hypothetical protein